MLLRKPKVEQENFDTEVHVETVELGALKDSVAQLIAGKFELFYSVTNSLALALKPVAEDLKSKIGTRLKGLVQVWVAQTEPMLAIAEMLRDMQDLEQRNQAMATASEEMAASIKEVARSASLVSQDSQTVKQELVSSVDAVHQAVSTMDGISEAFNSLTEKVEVLNKASEQIASILKTIEQIASQTNLLALNATIEAARAGEAGKGFAVVANEVKALSKQTSSATEDIRQRILALQSGMSDMLASMSDGSARVSHGTEAIKIVGEGITSVEQRVESVAQNMLSVSSTVEEQTKVTSEVAGNISAVVPMAQRMLQSINMLAETIEKSGSYIQKSLDESGKNPDPSTLILLTKADHASFKKRVIDTLIGRSHSKSGDLPDHTGCRLGKWYESITDAQMRSMPAFRNLLEPHQKVHAHGKKALDHFAKGNFTEALEEAKKLDKASTEVMAALDELHKSINEKA